MRTDIRDNRNVPIGYTSDDGNVTQAFHLKKGFVGRYVKASNITFDKSGNIFCYGDGTQTLVRNAEG